MNQRMRIVTMYLPRKRTDSRLVGAIVLVLIGLVMAYVMIDANMNIRSYQRESMPVTREVRP